MERFLDQSRLVSHMLRISRKERGMSMREVARRTGISVEMIRRYEQGICDIPVGKVIAMFDVLGWDAFVALKMKR